MSPAFYDPIMVVAVVSVVAMVGGALAYALSSNAKAAELGRLLFLAASIAFFLSVAHVTIRLG